MPINQQVRVPLAAEVAFAASGEHHTLFVIEGDPPDGMRIAKLTLVVSDLAGAVVYRATWCDPEHDAHDVGTDIDGLVPPANHTWTGVDNTAAAAPRITVPYLVTVSTLLVDAEAMEEVPEDLEDEALVVGCGQPPEEDAVDEEELDPCALTSLVFHASGQASTSRTPAALRVEEAGLPARLPFVSGVDDNVQVTWALDHAAQATGGVLELFEAGNPVAIWAANLDAPLVQGGQLTALNNPAVTFLDTHITLPRTPLRLRLRINGAPVDEDRREAWTWVEVQVTSFELKWGLGRVLAPNRPDVAAQVRAEIHRQELLLLRDAKGQPAPAQPWVAAPNLLHDDDGAGAVAINAMANLRLELSSNVHYGQIAEWANNTPFTAYRSTWGHGPRLPMVVAMQLRRATGVAVAAPAAAVAGAQVLWDWQDPQLNKHGGRPCPAFLQWVFERHNGGGGRSDNDSPPSTNCHVADGGKRGTGGEPVFPPMVGDGNNPVPDGAHPFGVAAHARRSWAALSSVYAGADPRFAGCTGAVFQPSRMGGDTYRVRAYLQLRDDPLVTHQLDGDAYWAAAAAVGLPHAQTGQVEIWRALDVLRYYNKSGGVAINWGTVNARFAPACLELRPPGAAADVNRLWADGNLDAVLGTDMGMFAGGNQRLLNALVPGAARAANGYMFPTQAWSRMAGQAVQAALQAGHVDPATNMRFVGLGGMVDPAAAANNAASWQRLLGNLHLGDFAALQGTVPGNFIATPDNVNVHVADTAVSFGHLCGHLLGQTRKQMASRILSLFAHYEDQNFSVGPGMGTPLCSTRPGIYAYHFESVATGLYDVSGSAVGPRGLDPANPETRKRGIFFVSATDWANKVEIDLQTNVIPTAPAVAAISQPAYLSQGFINGAESQLDYEAYCVLRAHTAALAVLTDLPATDIPVPGAPVAGTMVANAAHGVILEVRSETLALATQVGNDLDAAFNPAVQTGYFGNHHSEQSVYISLVTPFDRQRSEKVRFGAYSNNLSNANKREAREILLAILRRTHHPITNIHVYSRNTNRGNTRRGNVVNYLNQLIAEVRAHVHINVVGGPGTFGAVYGLEALTAHELGHTVFLGHQHDHLPWRHLPIAHVNCLMNYTPAAPGPDEFCGVCNLALRGWDTGPVNVGGHDHHRFHAFAGPPF